MGLTSPVAKSLARDLRRQISAGKVRDSIEDRVLYAYDGTGRKAPPDVVVMVSNPQEVAAVPRYASSHCIPVVPRGAGAGLSGGSISARGVSRWC